jgi:hypothetical protein
LPFSRVFPLFNTAIDGPLDEFSQLSEEAGLGLVMLIDREYRKKAANDLLPRIAPSRFNSEGEAWLPVLHTDRGKWHFTALHSNTARAHELGRVRDWVVIYFHDDGGGEAQYTVVTETRGPLLGRRVARGRESECLPFDEAGGNRKKLFFYGPMLALRVRLQQKVRKTHGT